MPCAGCAFLMAKRSKGLSNKLTGQAGEYLVCGELARRGLIATTFTGNVPEYDLLVCDDALRTLPIQVKTTRSETWPTQASYWLDIGFDHANKAQVNKGRREIVHPDLVYVSVAMGKTRVDDRYFVCQKSDIQSAAIAAYERWMVPKGWKRPRNYESLDNRYAISDLEPFEDNWDLVKDLLRADA